MVFQYKIYGLTLESSREIALLNPCKTEVPDLSITWYKDKAETPENHLHWDNIIFDEFEKRGISIFSTEVDSEIYYRISFKTVISAIIFVYSPDEKRLWIISDEEELDSDVDSYFVGPVMGCLLRIRGKVLLHGSVVNIDNKAIAVLGKSQSGKSTTAAAFIRLGYKILADDVVVISEKENAFFVETGYPRVRLRPKTLAVIHEEDGGNKPLVYSFEKSRYSDIAENFNQEPLQLGAIYILNDLKEADVVPHIAHLRPAEYIVRLNENNFANYAITKELRKHEFEVLRRIALSIPVRRIITDSELKYLNEQCFAIVENFRAYEAEGIIIK